MISEFNFFQNWYPVSPIEDIDPNLPTPITIIGKRLVIWKPKTSPNYQVFLDICSHRLAPLSEGRIDEKTGNLMCSYHGWQFNCEGICTHIPQAENSDIVNKNIDNFRIKTFPCRQEQGLLWVWLDENTPTLAANTPLPLSPQIDASKGFVWSSMVRDLEYDWQMLVENVADPSHVPFAHHGVQGNRENAKPIPIEIIESQPNLIKVQIERGLKTNITFEPPCRLEYAISIGNEGKQLGLITYCMPVTPGKSRIVAQFSRNFATSNLYKFTPRWWEHIKLRNFVLDGDMVLLQQQEYILKQKEKKGTWKTTYRLPTTADRLVIEFRKWFDKYCQGKLPWEEVGITDNKIYTIKDRQLVLDRYRQHTQHCHSCRTALKNIHLLQIILLTYFSISIPIVAVMPDTIRLKIGLPLMVVALLSVGLYSWLKLWLEPLFYFVDYIHPEK